MPVNMRGNWYDSRAGDGQNRSHVPAMPFWTAILRVFQLVLAFILLVLTAVAASKLGGVVTGWIGGDGMALCWFTFAWTLIYFIWLFVTVLMFPVGYHPYAQIAVEALTVIFWLATWASLASAASQLSGAYYSPTADAATLGIDVGTYVNSALGSYGNYLSDIRTAINCIKASAALGALEWVLFCVSLGFLIMAILAHRKSTAPAAGPEAAAVSTEPKPTGPVGTEPQQAHVPPQQYQQPYQVQQPYPQQQHVPQQQVPHEQVPQQQYQQPYQVPHEQAYPQQTAPAQTAPYPGT